MSHLSNILLGFGGYLLGASIAHLLMNTKISFKFTRTVQPVNMVDMYICIKESDYFRGIATGDVHTRIVTCVTAEDTVNIDLANYADNFAYFKSVPYCDIGNKLS